MRKKLNILLVLIPFLAVGLQSCSKWNSAEPIEQHFIYPWEKDPATWEKYFGLLNDYKAQEHTIVYAAFDNGNDKGDGELNYMRSLPDSLDIVSLTDADHFSKADREDMEWMHRTGTKVLYHVDYAARRAESPDEAALSAYLDKVCATVSAEGLDGFSFTGFPDYSGEDPMAAKAADLLVSRLDVEGKLLVFEGNPKFIKEADRAKVDYFVLATRTKEFEADVKFMISDARALGVKDTQLILSADMKGKMTTSSLEEARQLDKITAMTVSQGPVAGIALYGIADDYYHSDSNYVEVRETIQKLNPSK